LDKKLLKTGVIGIIVTALCCFTPILVWLFLALGLSAVIGYLDMILFPVLFIFICMTGYALWQRSQKT